MSIFEIIKDSLEIIISLITLILVGIGLRMWKIQLKGENTFKLSLDVLRELKLTLAAIDDYRRPFVPANETYMAFSKHNNGKYPDMMNNEERKLAHRCVDIERWNNIIDQFNIYNDSILKLAISINNYEIDLVNGKRLKDYLMEMDFNRSRKEFADDEKEQLGPTDKDERDRLREEYLDINSVLTRRSTKEDLWGKNIEQYFVEMNKRLREYIK